VIKIRLWPIDLFNLNDPVKTQNAEIPLLISDHRPSASEMQSALSFLSLAVASGFGILLIALAPLFDALEFGTDEGYELMKGFLVSRGYSLYGEIWSDQPPLHTALLALVFKLAGVSAGAARGLTVLFAAVLVWSFYELIRIRSGNAVAILGSVVLVLSPHFFQLSVSAMIVLPAMSLGLFSVWLLFHSETKSARWWLVSSGVVMGLALQIKFAAALFIPAMLVELILREWRSSAETAVNSPRIHEAHINDGRSNLIRTMPALLVWGTGAAAGFGLVLAFFAEGTFDLLLGTHFSKETRLAFGGSDSLVRFHRDLWNDPGTLAASLAGLIWILWRRAWKHLFPLVLLITVYIFHCFHRPYWDFHYLHFAIPIAWLSATVIGELARYLYRLDRKRSFAGAGIYFVWSALLALLLADLPGKVKRSWSSITRVQMAADQPLVRELQSYAGRVDWVVVSWNIYAFHAGIPVPPPLAVVSQKRTRSGRFDSEALLEVIMHYEPELIALPDWEQRDRKLLDYLAHEYVPVNHSSSRMLRRRTEDLEFDRNEQTQPISTSGLSSREE
jgi:4-amino-4-deoxy-L-arabinose transferase-like glycosyltransferase